MAKSKSRDIRLPVFFSILLIGAIIGAVGLYATQWSLRATSTTEFCVSCHSMDLPDAEWQGTNHFANAQGIQAGCADCHIPHEGFAYLKKKITSGVSDLYAEITGSIPNAHAYEEKRAEMARKVWAEMEENDSRTCRSCHNTEFWDPFEQSAKAATAHRSMAQSAQTCIDCHRGIAHFPPEFGNEAQAAGGELSQLASTTPEDADVLYPIRQRELFESKDGTQQIARILPSTRLQVLDRDGDWRKVQVDGFQPPDVKQVLYRSPGKRIIAASIAEPKQLTNETTNNDVGWDQSRITGWVKADNMIADAQPIWHYGEELNNAYCGNCHSVMGPQNYTANQWPAMVDAYAGRTSISDVDKSLLTFYLQTHAKDMPAQGESNE